MRRAQARGSGGAARAAPGVQPIAVGLFDALDARLQAAVEQFRAPVAEQADTPLRGLYISDGEVDGLLTGAGRPDGAPPAQHARVEQVAAQLPCLARTFALDALDLDILLICLAPELDLRYERLYGYLQDDMTRRRPTVDLLLRLLDQDSPEVRHALGPGGRLQRRGLVATLKTEVPEDGAFLSTSLRVDPRLTEYLLGLGGLTGVWRSGRR